MGAIAWLLFAIAGLVFFWGGRAISEFGKVGRLLAELEGLAIAVACGALGAIAKTAEKHLETSKQSSTTDESA